MIINMVMLIVIIKISSMIIIIIDMLILCGADEQSTFLSHAKIECNFVDRFLPVIGMLTLIWFSLFFSS